jgi:Bacterial regulatory protein, arsR family
MTKQTTAPSDPKVVKALKLIESGKQTVRGACANTGANRSTVRHHLRARGFSAAAVKAAPKPKKAKAKKTVKKSTAMVVESNAIQHHLIESADGQKSLTVFIPGEAPVIVAGDHPKFDDILAEVSGNAAPNVERLRELADTTVLVSTKFEALTDRITTRNGRLYFDGDELDNSLTQKILAMLDEGSEDWPAFVAFMDKLYLNPNPNARDAFYGWLSSRPFGLTPEGDVIGYKGVEACEGEAEFQSHHNGPAIINGEEYDGSGEGVPQSIGDVVEKPRSSVDTSQTNECSDGLHVGTYSFASGQFGPTTLKVIVNPRDVVGVPASVRGSQKFRCCRYTIDSVATGKDTEPVATN